MLDLQFVCDNQELVAENCRNRGIEADVGAIVELRNRRNQLINEGDQLRHEQKETSSQIPNATDARQKQALIAQGKQLRERVHGIEQELKEVAGTLRAHQSSLPNLTHPQAPIGKDETSSTVLRTWGAVPKFDFKPLDHVALAEKHDLIDFEAGARIAGHGFYFLKNQAVFLELALLQYAAEKLSSEGFTLHTTPDMARDEILEGIGFIPRGPETQIYSIADTRLSLVATAEITLGGALQNQVLDTSQLPIKVAGISHCFRTEAGAHGRAGRGIYRVHQFTKLENVRIHASGARGLRWVSRGVGTD